MRPILENHCLLHVLWTIGKVWAQLAVDRTVVSFLRKNGAPWLWSSGWGFLGDSQSAEEKTVPRAAGPVWEIPSCCLRVRKWRTAVRGNMKFLATPGQSQSSWGGSSMVVAMARHHGLQCCQIIRCVFHRITDVCDLWREHPKNREIIGDSRYEPVGEQKVFGVFGDSVTVCFHFWRLFFRVRKIWCQNFIESNTMRLSCLTRVFCNSDKFFGFVQCTAAAHVYPTADLFQIRSQHLWHFTCSWMFCWLYIDGLFFVLKTTFSVIFALLLFQSWNNTSKIFLVIMFVHWPCGSSTFPLYFFAQASQCVAPLGSLQRLCSRVAHFSIHLFSNKTHWLCNLCVKIFFCPSSRQSLFLPWPQLFLQAADLDPPHRREVMFFISAVGLHHPPDNVWLFFCNVVFFQSFPAKLNDLCVIEISTRQNTSWERTESNIQQRHQRIGCKWNIVSDVESISLWAMKCGWVLWCSQKKNVFVCACGEGSVCTLRCVQ